MAIGDNIPKIFGNLAETSMKSMGDFQYHLDLLNNIDADQEMAFRNEANNTFGPPAPMSGPLIDQFLLMTNNDPMAATDMTLQESIMENAPDNTELNKNRMAAEALYNYSHGTVGSDLINNFANNMGITPIDLQSSYDSVDARVMFNTLGDIDITSGENLIQSIPGTPNDLPPMARGPIDDNERSPIGDDPPPFEPDSSDYNTSLFGFGLGDIKGALFPDAENREKRRRALFGGMKDYVSETYIDPLIIEPFAPLFPGNPVTPPPSAEMVEGFVDNWEYMEKPELDAAINQRILQDYSPDSIKLLEEGDPITVSNFNEEREIIKNMYPVDLTEDAEVTISDMVAAPTDEEKRPFLGSGDVTYNPVPFGPDELSRRSVGSVGPQVSATYEDLPYSKTFANRTPYEQWGPYMQQMIPSYNAPRVQDAYKRGFQPFHGTWLLSPERDNFASFMHEYKPEQFPQFEWDAFQPQWNELLDWADSLNSNDVSTVTKSTDNFTANNNKLWTALTGENAAENAVSLALSRYNEGNMPLPSYRSRQLHQSLTTMLNNQAKRDVYTGDPNTITNFLANLAEMNPERFGR